MVDPTAGIYFRAILAAFAMLIVNLFLWWKPAALLDRLFFGRKESFDERLKITGEIASIHHRIFPLGAFLIVNVPCAIAEGIFFSISDDRLIFVYLLFLTMLIPWIALAASMTKAWKTYWQSR
jgi:hypothetical protein